MSLINDRQADILGQTQERHSNEDMNRGEALELYRHSSRHAVGDAQALKPMAALGHSNGWRRRAARTDLAAGAPRDLLTAAKAEIRPTAAKGILCIPSKLAERERERGAGQHLSDAPDRRQTRERER